MAYATQANVNALTNDLVSSLSVPSFATIAAIVDKWVDARIATVANLPFTTTPDAVKLAADYRACYEILRSKFTSDNPNASAWVDSFKEAADEQIEAILGDPDGTLGTAVSDSGSTVAGSSTLSDDAPFQNEIVQDDAVVDEGNMRYEDGNF